MKRIDTTGWKNAYPPSTHMGEQLKAIAEGVNEVMNYLEVKFARRITPVERAHQVRLEQSRQDAIQMGERLNG